MQRIPAVALLGSLSLLFACSASPSPGQSSTSSAAEGTPCPTDDAGGGGADASSGSPDAGTDDAGDPDGSTPPAAPYTLTITAPTPNAAVTGAIDVVGVGPGFVNLEIHAPSGELLARVTPDGAGNFSAPVDTTRLGNGAQTLAIDAWDAPAGSAYAHHASAPLPLGVTNARPSCMDANGHGIRYFGAYTKNTQTNYDFDAFAGFHQDFLTSFASCDTWEHAASSDWGFDIMKLQPPGENIQEIVCLTTSEDPSLQHVASGTYDAYIQRAANLFVAHGYPNAFVRIGHEFDGDWYPWGLAGGPNNADYSGFIAAFRHVAGILKATVPTLTIVWNPGCGYYAEALKSDQAYPGDDVVDVIGVDCYDDGSGIDHIFNGAYGMNQWAAFAKQHGKPIAVPEWGLMNGGDDPAYIQAMFDFLVSNDTFLEAFWDSDDGSTKSQISTGEAPNAGAKFQQTFGAYAKACRP